MAACNTCLSCVRFIVLKHTLHVHGMSFSYSAPSVWKSIPLSIRSSPTFNQLKNKNKNNSQVIHELKNWYSNDFLLKCENACPTRSSEVLRSVAPVSLICYYWSRSDARWFFVCCCCFFLLLFLFLFFLFFWWWLGGGFASLCVNENHEYSQGLPSSGTTYMFYAQVYV